jgi:hypothetical protein
MPVVMDDLSMSEEEALTTRPSRMLCSKVPSSNIFCSRKLSANLAELEEGPLFKLKLDQVRADFIEKKLTCHQIC